MKEHERVTKALAAIERGIEEARQNPKPGEPIPADDYVAFCVMQTLRQAGFKIVPNENSN